MSRRLVAVALLLALGAARADEVRLRNGSTLIGKIVEQSEREVRFRTPAGILTVPRADIVSVKRAPPPLDVYATRAAALADDDAQGHLDLADFCTKYRLTKQAVAQLRQALAAQPDHKLAAARLRKLIDPPAASLLARAKELQDQGDHEQAETPLTTLLERYPESTHAAAAHHRLAVGYAARRQLDQALIRWRRALNLRPDYAEACEGAADACIQLADWRQALQFTEQAIDIRHDQPQASALRQRAQAIRQLAALDKQAGDTRPSPQRLATQGRLLLQLGLVEPGVQRLEAAYDAGARDPKLLAFLADRYERAGRVRHALELCEALAAVSRVDDDLVRRRARLHRLLLIPDALATRDRVERRRILHEVANSGASFAYIQAALRESAVREPREPGLVQGSFMVDEVLVRASYTCYVPNGYDPRRPWPLILAFHRDKDKGKDHFYNWESVAKTDRYIILCPTAPAGGKWTFDDLPLPLSALRHAARLYNIDTNRVYVAGTGSGGLLAWAIALRHPDRFAALVVRNARLDEVTRLYLPAAITLPVYQLVSERARPEVIGSLREADAAMARWNYQARREEVPGSRHPAMPELNDKIAQWLDDKARDPYSPRVRFLAFQFANAECYWLRIDRFAGSVFDPDAKLDSDGLTQGPLGIRLTEEQIRQLYMAKMKQTLGSVSAVVSRGNIVRIATRHVTDLTVSLDDRLVDLDKPVRIVLNGRTAFQGKIQRSLESLFEGARRRGDPRLCYSARVRLQVK